MSISTHLDASVWHERPLIWVVDDEEEVVSLLQEILEEGGYHYEGFLDAKNALDALDVLEKEPSLIFLDLIMAGISGLDFLRTLRQRGFEMPVVVLTARSSESILLNAFDAGADDVIHKPFGVAELLMRLRWQLNQSKRIRVLRNSHKYLDALLELSLDLGQQKTSAQVLELYCKRIPQLVHVETCVVYVRDVCGDLRSVVDATHILDLSLIPDQELELTARQHALLHAQHIEALGLATHSGLTGLLVPLRHDGALFGVVLVTSTDSVYPQPQTTLKLLSRSACVLSSMLYGIKETSELSHRFMELHGLNSSFLWRVLEASPDAIVAADGHGSIMVFNAAAERILGWSSGEALGQNIGVLHEAGDADRIMKALREDDSGRISNVRRTLRDRDGRMIPVKMSATLLFDELNQEVGAVGVFTDLRPRIQIEARLEEATQDLERSRQQVLAAEVAGAAAHELNQPLTSLLGYIELLLAHQERSPQEQKALDIMSADANRIADIVRKLSSITQFRTRGYVGHTRIMDLEAGKSEE